MTEFSSFAKYLVLKDHEELADAVLFSFQDAANECNIPFYVYYGVCLGFIREGGYVELDNDIDMLIFCSFEEWRSLAENLMQRGFTGIVQDVGWIFKDKIMIDLGRKEGNNQVFDQIVYKGRVFNVPHPVEEYLTETYGEDWRTPKPYQTYVDYREMRVERRRQTQDSWDRSAEKWIPKPFEEWQITEREDFIHCLNSERILDLGCGNGRDLEFFEEKGYTCIGIDFSKAMQKGVLAEATKLPFTDNVFDGVWCSSVLKYLLREELSICLREIFRVLKRGGVLFAGLDEGEGVKQENGFQFTLYTESSFLFFAEPVGFTNRKTTRIEAWRNFITFLLEKN